MALNPNGDWSLGRTARRPIPDQNLRACAREKPRRSSRVTSRSSASRRARITASISCVGSPGRCRRSNSAISPSEPDSGPKSWPETPSCACTRHASRGNRNQLLENHAAVIGKKRRHARHFVAKIEPESRRTLQLPESALFELTVNGCHFVERAPNWRGEPNRLEPSFKPLCARFQTTPIESRGPLLRRF